MLAQKEEIKNIGEKTKDCMHKIYEGIKKGNLVDDVTCLAMLNAACSERMKWYAKQGNFIFKLYKTPFAALAKGVFILIFTLSSAYHPRKEGQTAEAYCPYNNRSQNNSCKNCRNSNF